MNDHMNKTKNLKTDTKMKLECPKAVVLQSKTQRVWKKKKSLILMRAGHNLCKIIFGLHLAFY